MSKVVDEIDFGESPSRFRLVVRKGSSRHKWLLYALPEGAAKVLVAKGRARGRDEALKAADAFISRDLAATLEKAAAVSVARLAARDARTLEEVACTAPTE